MTDQQKVREAFEAYWSERSWNVERIDNPSGYVEYKNHDLHHIWMGWQAALAHASSEDNGGEVVAWIVPQWRGMPDGSIEDGPDKLVFEDEATTYETRIGVPLYTRPAPSAEDARDARRYRRVRSSCGEFVRYAGAGSHHLLEDDELDKAIDQALASERGEA